LCLSGRFNPTENGIFKRFSKETWPFDMIRIMGLEVVRWGHYGTSTSVTSSSKWSFGNCL
jgi:hypothetical protein